MVDALNEASRVLKPEGTLLDLRPIGTLGPIEILAETTEEVVGRLDGTPGEADDRACQRAVDTLVSTGRLSVASVTRFELPYHWDSASELQDDLAEARDRRTAPPSAADLAAMAHAYDRHGWDHPVRCVTPIHLGVYRRAGA